MRHTMPWHSASVAFSSLRMSDMSDVSREPDGAGGCGEAWPDTESDSPPWSCGAITLAAALAVASGVCLGDGSNVNYSFHYVMCS